MHHSAKPLFAALALGLAGLTGTAQAANFTVTEDTVCADASPANCPVIDFIEQANANTEADTIDLGGHTVSLTAVHNQANIATASGGNALPSIVAGGGSLTIRNGIIERSATSNATLRLMHVSDAGDLRLEAVTLRGGGRPDVPHGRGGAIFSRGTLVLERCTVTGNNARQLSGGGIFVGAGIATLVNTTISGNAAGFDGSGGGLAVSTIGEDAPQLVLLNSTITGNYSTNSGGFDAGFGSRIDLRNSIISGNTADSSLRNEARILTGSSRPAMIVSQGGNLFGHSGLANTEGFTPGPDDLVPAGALNTILDPTLASNGGPTQTHALVAGSPAVDFVPTANCAVTDDQRGVDRPKGSGCDAGAFEVGTDSIDLGIRKIAPVSATVGDVLPYNLIVTNDGPDDASSVRVVDPLPAEVQFVSAASTQGSCGLSADRPDEERVVCELGALASGAGVEIVIVTTAVQPGLVSNTADVFSTNRLVEIDANGANNEGSASTQIDAVDTGPDYAASVQQPIDADGRSTFNAKRGVVPVKFRLTADGTSTCTLPPASISVSRLGGTTSQPIDESVFSGAADSGSSFRITDCQYHYNLNVKAFGAGSYQVDILIDGDSVGSARFALK